MPKTQNRGNSRLIDTHFLSREPINIIEDAQTKTPGLSPSLSGPIVSVLLITDRTLGKRTEGQVTRVRSGDTRDPRRVRGRKNVKDEGFYRDILLRLCLGRC